MILAGLLERLVQVFLAYTERKGLARTDCKFLFDGQILKGDQTPEQVVALSINRCKCPASAVDQAFVANVLQLELEDNDFIDMMREQQGGSARLHHTQ